MKKFKNKKYELAITTIIASAISIFIVWVCLIQLKQYETGLIDVSADQQDAYVQLVLDQINLKENRDNDEIIKKILSTLDVSSNKYWMFSEDQTLLYVKDVTETNRYKGLTAQSYFNSESAQEYVESIEVDRVTHTTITLNEKNYIVSGVAFVSNGHTYKLVLLTNKDVLLDNNKYLEAKTQITLMIIVTLVVQVLVILFSAHRIQKLNNEMDEKDQMMDELNEVITKLNKRIASRNIYNARYKIWKSDTFAQFLKKLLEKKPKHLSVIRIHCEDEECKKEMLAKMYLLFEQEVLRFEAGENDIVIMVVKQPSKAVMEALSKYLKEGITIGQQLNIKDCSESEIPEIVAKLGMEE